MSFMELINRARVFAQAAHEGQKDDDGNDYFTAHLCHAARIVEAAGGSHEMVAAALLHDTLEDTKTTYDELVAEFGADVANLVREMTHEGQKDSYGHYFPNLTSRDAIVIKLADRMSNLLRMDSWSEERQKQYLRKTKFWKDGRDK